MTRIKFTDGTLVRGAHFSAGDVAEISNEDAALVVGAGRARFYAEEVPQPAVEPVETAATAPAPETASVRRTRTRK